MSNDPIALQTALNDALERAASAEYESTRLQLQLDVAEQRIADLEDFVPMGNSDPLLEQVGRTKARVGRSAVGRRFAHLYRRILQR